MTFLDVYDQKPWHPVWNTERMHLNQRKNELRIHKVKEVAANKQVIKYFAEVKVSILLKMKKSKIPDVWKKAERRYTVFLVSFKEDTFFSFKILCSERGKGREKERERNSNVRLSIVCPPLGIWSETQACVLTGNRTNDPLVHRLALNPLNHTS